MSNAGRRREAMRAAARRPSLALRSPQSPARQEKPQSDPTPAPGANADVFVSYARTDVEIVRDLVSRLRTVGASVTWDQDFTGGTDFSEAISAAIDGARAVIVVWSEAATRSGFVRGEAARATKKSRLVTTHVPGFDADDAPLGFNHLHAIPIADFDLVRRSLSEHGVAFRD